MQVLEILETYIGRDLKLFKAKEVEKIVATELSFHGTVFREVKVPNRGDGHKGRIDIVFLSKRDGKKIAIEIDRNTIRQKSYFKLKHYECDERLVITRSPFNIFRL